jgi:hypothetical protein
MVSCRPLHIRSSLAAEESKLDLSCSPTILRFATCRSDEPSLLVLKDSRSLPSASGELSVQLLACSLPADGIRLSRTWQSAPGQVRSAVATAIATGYR